jgi:PPIC-type PPIASE domain
MRTSWLVCVLLGAVAWGQAAPGAPAQAPMQGPMSGMPKPPVALPDTAASVSESAAVITIKGVCPAQPKPAVAKGATVKPASVTTKTSAADCKTVITKAEFEKLANAVSPNVTPQLKKQLAGVLPRFIAMSDAAKKQGLDKTPQFAETVKFAKMQILTQELQRKIQTDAAKVPESEIASYYKEHADSYEQFSLDRLFVPRNKQVQPDAKDKDKEDDDKDAKLTDDQKKEKEKEKEADEKAKTEQGEADMTKLAETLRERAAAGEDFAKLQKEAFEAAGMKIESPTVTLPKLPPAHAAVFDLKVGEVSQVINDSGGHYIYKVDTKDQLTLDQARQEIQTALQNKRSKDMLDKLNGSFQVDTNEAYFGPMTPAMPPGRGGMSQHMPNPRTPPGPTPAPASAGGTQPQTPPAAQAPAQTPPPAQSQDSKPN